MEPEDEQIKLSWWERLAGVAFSLLLMVCASPGARHLVVLGIVILVIVFYKLSCAFGDDDR